MKVFKTECCSKWPHTLRSRFEKKYVLLSLCFHECYYDISSSLLVQN
jgi:hypothetical protein